MNYKNPLAALVVALACSPAFSQQGAPSTDRVVYEAAFYSAFTPRTALDMINQTPGFVLAASENDQERRGFSGAVGNVLIDGQRLGAKSQSLQDVLGRVAAKEVLRIEVLRGAAVAGDASGAAVLANVVRTPTSGGGTWEAGAEMTNQHVLKPNGSFGWSGRKETTEFSVGGNAYTHDHLSAGRFDVEDGEGILLGYKREPIPHQHAEYALNGQLAFPVSAGKLTLTGLISYFEHDEQTEQQMLTPELEQVARETFPFAERTRTAEAGATWQAPLGSWELDLTALATRKYNRWHVTATELDAADIPISEAFQQVDTDSGETIMRGTASRNLDSGRFEFGAEAAVNTLDGAQQLTVDSAPVVLPNANLSVKETRGEGFASHVWRISKVWSLDSRLAVETSRLSFTGDTEKSVSLTYVKPRVQLTRQLGPHQIQLRVFRDVGQLDFNDFVTTTSFANDLVEGGNPDLRPQTAWAAEIEADLRFPGDAALRVRGFRHFVSDVVDFVPVGEPGEQFDAPGNIGDGRIIGAEITARVPLKALLPGAAINVTGIWQDTDVKDPLTGRHRMFSDTNENHLRAEFRQDLNAARFAWGASYEASSMNSQFRLSEINRFRELQRLDVFVETTWIDNVKVRLEAQSALNSEEKRDRRLYAPDRLGSLVRRDIGGYLPGHWWLLSVSSHF
jgi:hypothetical protein